jgi:hypothetical protein
MKRKFSTFVLIVFAVGAVGLGSFVFTRPSSRQQLDAKPGMPPGGIEQPAVQTDRAVAPPEPVFSLPVATPPPVVVHRAPLPVPVIPAAVHKSAPVRIYTAASYSVEAPKTEVKEADPAPFAPAYRLVRCKLFNTVNSGTNQNPLIGVVTDDLVWGGDVVIPRCTEVHGMAQVGQMHDRIISEGPFTFVFQDGRQLVVSGMALDRGYNPQYKTYAITEASGGIIGSVIKTDNAAEIKLFVSTFISGVAQGLKGTTSGFFGVYDNPNARGVANVPGYAINPTVQGAQNVLDLYAARVLEGIQRDGYFVVVPAGKQFNVYVTQDIDLAKASVRGDQRRGEAKADFLRDRKVDEEVTQPRSERDALKAQGPQNGFMGVPQLDQLDQSLSAPPKPNGQTQTRGKPLRAQADLLNARAEAEAAK